MPKELESDFIITYDDKKDQASLEKLILLLNEKGFYTQVKDFNESSLLIFIKLAHYKLNELCEKDLIRNYEFGITASIDNRADKLRIIYDFLTGSTLDDLDLFKFSHVKNISPVNKSINDTTVYQDVTAHLFSWKNPSTNFIKENFGIRVALYFEFVKFLINWLGFLSVFGIISFFKYKGAFSFTFCAVNLVWGCLCICFWKKREKYLVSFWGYSNYHLTQDHKLQLVDINEYFETKSEYSHHDNYEGYKFLKQLLFIPVAIIFAVALVVFQLGCFVLEIFIREIYDGPGKLFLALIPTVMLSVFVPVLTIVFNKVSDILIKFENHNNDYTKNNSILLKQFVLNFLTSYMPLLITSFIYLPFAHLIKPNLPVIQSSIEKNVNSSRFYYKYLTQLKNHENFVINQERLSIQFFYFVVTNQVVQLVLKYGLPQIIGFVMQFIAKNDYVPKDTPSESVWLQNVRKYVSLPSYNVNDDFRFIVITYGYLILFGPVWSVAPLVSLIFLVITLKLDYFKLLNGKYFQPPIPERADSIYPWNYALFLLTWLGSIVSPAISAFYRHGKEPPKSMGQFVLDNASVHTKSSHLLIILLLSEHSFLLLWYLLNKLFDFFKSDKEWENDFTDNDIKLRHDYYSSKVKGHFKHSTDGKWSTCTPELSLKQAENIINGNIVEEDDDHQKGTEHVDASGVLTGVNVGDYENLRKVKDKSDKIINVPSPDIDGNGVPDGNGTYATIDNNRHVPLPTPGKDEGRYQKDYESSATPDEPQGQGVDIDQRGDENYSEERGVDEVDDDINSSSIGKDEKSIKSSDRSIKSAKKKSPLKKLLKRNK